MQTSVRGGGVSYLRRVHVVLSHHDARRVQRPVDFIGQGAFEGNDGMMQPPQIPRLHVAVLSCCHQQVPEEEKEGREMRTTLMRQMESPLDCQSSRIVLN